MKKIKYIVLFACLAFAGCGLIFGGASATARRLFALAESNQPQEMTKLFSSKYLQENKKIDEDNEKFSELVQTAMSNGERPAVSDLTETAVGDKAMVKLRYGSPRGGNLPFQMLLAKENGEWKIEKITGDWETDLTKEKPVIEKSKEFVREFDTDEGEPFAMRFSPDSKMLAQVLRNGGKLSINLLDAQTGAIRAVVPVEAKYSIYGLDFSADGRKFANTTGTENINVWNADNTSVPAATVTLTEEPITVRFAPNGDLYAGGQYGSLISFDAATGKEKRNFTPGAGKPGGRQIEEIAFSPDGSLVATAARAEIKLWDAKTGKLLKTLLDTSDEGDSFEIAFSADGKTLYSYSKQSTLQAWNTATGAAAMTKDLGKTYLGSASFSADGRLMAVVGGETDKPGAIKIYDTATGELKATLNGHEDSVSDAVFSLDGKLVVSRGYSNSGVYLWDASKF